MKFMGSKARISKYILPIILKDRIPTQYYVEPFVGGGNILDKVTGNRIGSDNNIYVVSALQLIRDNVSMLPKNNTEFTIKDYKDIRKSTTVLPGIKGYTGFALSYGGKWFGGWRRDSQGKRDYIAEAYRNAVKQSLQLQGTILIHSSYEDLSIPPNSIIYCDPPYKGTTKYTTKFNHKAFWDWCREKVHEGHKVFVSEYTAPKDFKSIWKTIVTSSLTRNTGGKYGLEQLFILED